MIIHGIDRQFEFTVGAYKDLARLCRDGDVAHIDELFMGSTAETVENVAKVALILNRRHEKKRMYEGDRTLVRPLGEDELETLSVQQLLELQKEILAAMKATGEVEVDFKKNGEIGE